MNDLALNPATTALLLMDLQAGILESHSGAEALLPGLLRAREAARQAGFTVGYVRVALTPEDAAKALTTPGSFAAAAASGRLDDASPATQIDARILPAGGEIVVRKSRVGAFGTTDLDDQLRARGIDTLVLAGISTSGVVLSTVRDASDCDYRIVVLADGCFDRDEEVHRVLTQKVFTRQATVVSIDEFVAAIG
ncbi:cysteine hydrolase family protein [Leifsonia poae]|uniref:cysteine hydrolase family protein n=1 Tax=Leifsonia poae TaxID=110933 RepID=UPI003D670074